MNLPNVPSLKLSVGFDTSRIGAMAAPISAIVISVIVLFFIVWPKFSSVLALRSENKGLEDRVQQLITKVGILSSFDKIELQQDLGYAEALLPSDKATFSMIHQIESAAGSSGVVLSKVDVAPGSVSADSSTGGSGVQAAPAGQASKEPDAAPKIQVRISTTGDYNSFLNFLSTISSVSRVTSIEDLTLSSSSTQGVVAPLKVSMVINAYWKPRATKLGQIESPVSKLTDSEQARLDKVKTAVGVGQPSFSEVPSVPIGRSDLFAPF
ncbi:hypothetical protein A2870_03690 [Candidatus Curtissbacteria bacterium RIFCSPHIGHO2_01_FULL_41_11]|uniref:Pilus assembly protein PilO n=1 Tax=Candidatus Curtissbacteria bacterium RIFCSPHIGHO2_01_FULL_41_11 TaxID=1797711 RepID=A0A1F5G5R7_9BACT|nr:MAG: hypothetical protein A2870_03690 [Candidatus Curtissbacteria bacterium RIFCSPHIGHO2_01_FULL_41_11]